MRREIPLIPRAFDSPVGDGTESSISNAYLDRPARLHPPSLLATLCTPILSTNFTLTTQT